MSPSPARPDTKPLARRRLYDRCRAGQEPAELLDPADRARLVRELAAEGLTDTEIAAHTHMSTYTAWRIRTQPTGDA